MFTIKVYRSYITDQSKGLHNDKVSIYQGRSVEISDQEGIVVFGMSGTDEEAWIPYPNVECAPSDDDDWRVVRVVIENAAGKTTEVIHG